MTVAEARAVLAAADPEEPKGSPSPAQVEAAVMVMDAIKRRRAGQ